MTMFDHLIYGLLWLSFGFGHSVLAGDAVKQRLQRVAGGAYRLLYNLFAALHIALVVFGGGLLLADRAAPFAWSAEMEAVLIAARWAGLAVLIGSLTQYDLGRFSGMTQLRRDEPADENEPLHLSGIHRYVRHPLYAGVYLLLWSRVGDEFSLATAIWGSLYLAIGTHFEERRLLRLHGAEYGNYRASVPALIPWRGRAI